MATEEFNRLWEFDDGQEVCIKHSRKNKEYLRVDGKDKEDIDWDGKIGGPKAIWKVHVDPESNIVQFESIKTGKFLNIEKDGHGWQCTGRKDGPRARFILERYGKGSAILKLEKEFDDTPRCVGSKNGDPRPVQIFTRGERQDFSTPFDKDSADKKVIIIQRSHDCNQLRVKKDDVILNREGGTGDAAQWKIINTDGSFRFKSCKKGEFLRIKKNGKEVDIGGKIDGNLTEFQVEEIFEDIGHHVQLKSVATGSYIGVDDEGIVKGFEEQSEKTRFTFFCQNE
jgi:hypothetical protein